MQQLVGALVRLRISLNLVLPLLPGADIREAPQRSHEPHQQGKAGQDAGSKPAQNEGDRQPAVQIAVE